MIQGIGLDIIEVERIKKALERRGDALLQKLFTQREQLYHKLLKPDPLAVHVAGRFAAKEAVVKALGTGFRGIDWKDVEILSDILGKPVVYLQTTIADRFDSPELLLTITHSKLHAAAVCIWQK